MPLKTVVKTKKNGTTKAKAIRPKKPKSKARTWKMGK